MHELFDKVVNGAVVALAIVVFGGMVAKFAVYAYCDVRDLWRRRTSRERQDSNSGNSSGEGKDV